MPGPDATTDRPCRWGRYSVIDPVEREQLGTARERLAQLVDRFITAYLAVNPKPERSRH